MRALQLLCKSKPKLRDYLIRGNPVFLTLKGLQGVLGFAAFVLRGFSRGIRCDI